MKIETVYSDLVVNVDLKNKITVLEDYAGIGKTFLFKIICDYCINEKIRFSAFDYRNLQDSLDSFKVRLKDTQINLFDNADLYMTKDLWNEIRKTNGCSIISIKDIDHVAMQNDYDICTVSFDNDTIKLENFV